MSYVKLVYDVSLKEKHGLKKAYSNGLWDK